MVTVAASLVKSGRVCEECCMAVSAWLSNMAFKPFPGGTRASPCQANFLCKGGSELHKVLCGSERPLCKKANWHIFSPSHGGCFLSAKRLPSCSRGGTPALLLFCKQGGWAETNTGGFTSRRFGPTCLLCVFSFGLAGRLLFLASGMTDRVYRCD